MAKQTEPHAKPKLTARIATFVQANRFVFLIAIATIFVLLVAFIIFSEVRSSRVQKSTTLVEQAQTDYNTWSTASDAKKKDIEAKLLGELDTIVKRYPHLYAAQRAIFIRASVYYDKKEWKLSAENYSRLAASFPKSYLATISLVDAGAAYEQAGDNTSAEKEYKKLVDNYGTGSPEKPLALFSLGRLAEAKKDYAAAKTQYDKLVSDFPSSSWTNLARDRIIYLQTEGLVPQKQS